MRCGEKGIGVRDWLSPTVACQSVESAGAKSACALWLVTGLDAVAGIVICLLPPREGNAILGGTVEVLVAFGVKLPFVVFSNARSSSEDSSYSP